MNNFAEISDISNEARGWRGESSSDFNCLALRGVSPERVGVPFLSPLKGLFVLLCTFSTFHPTFGIASLDQRAEEGGDIAAGAQHPKKQTSGVGDARCSSETCPGLRMH